MIFGDAATKTDELVFAIQELSAGEIRKNQAEIETYVRHRSALVRFEAIEALGRARVGAAAVRRALRRERDVLVLTSLCEAALLLVDRASLPLLRRYCRHRSWLVRKHAGWAVSEIEEAKAIPFLRRLLAEEASRRVRSVLQAGLFKWGVDDVLTDLLANLSSRDYLVRCITANALGRNIDRRVRRHDVLDALKFALAREKTVAASEAITEAIAAWNPRSKGR